MKIGNDILESVARPSCKVPDGYFDDLKSRLSSIPAEKTVSPGLWMKVRPYAALAASFAAILVIGNSVLHNTASRTQSSEGDFGGATYAEVISLVSPESVYNAMEYEQEAISEEDIINYLIESGVRTEHLAYAGNQQETK